MDNSRRENALPSPLYFNGDNYFLYCEDALLMLRTFKDKYFDCIITSPPLKNLSENYIGMIHTELRRIVKPAGAIWINYGEFPMLSEARDKDVQTIAGVIATLIESACPKGGIVLDPFMGNGITGVITSFCGRKYVGVDKDPSQVINASERIKSITHELHKPKPTVSTGDTHGHQKKS